MELPKERSEAFVLVDVGARGGTEKRWAVLGKHIVVMAFDVDEDAITTDNAYFEVLKIPRVLAAAAEERALFVTKNLQRSSTIPPDRTIANRFPGAEGFDYTSVLKVDATTLDLVCRDFNVDRVDFLKIDTQGSELSILQGGQAAIGGAVGIDIEVEFLPVYTGQPLFSDVDTFLRERGFELFDMNRLYWKTVAGSRIQGKGQMIAADALYFKSPELVLEGEPQVVKNRVLKACPIAAVAYRYFEYSYNLLVQAKEQKLINEFEFDRTMAFLEQNGLKKSRNQRQQTGAGFKVVDAIRQIAESLAADRPFHTDGRLGNTKK